MPYRIVRDRYRGYEAQHRFWWCPIWFEIRYLRYGCNSSRTLAGAQAVCDWHLQQQLVWFYLPHL